MYDVVPDVVNTVPEARDDVVACIHEPAEAFEKNCSTSPGIFEKNDEMSCQWLMMMGRISDMPPVNGTRIAFRTVGPHRSMKCQRHRRRSLLRGRRLR